MRKKEIKKRINYKLRSQTRNLSPSQSIDQSVLSYRIKEEVVPIAELNSERTH
jgi:hypothetical protein